jgi:NadR type nicotinamide-nucleotide adenylyltransferase
MKTGLTLGKFAPLHKGHQRLIETALAEMDHVIVIVYQATDVTQVPLWVRAEWVRKIYPDVEVIEASDGPQVTGYTKEIVDLQNDYLIRALNGQKITAFYSSEAYGTHVSKALGCENRIVDLSRKVVPVSGTAIRESFWENVSELHPVVRADLLPRIVFLGGPSTGKTTLSRAFARRHDEPVCEEYGRNYWFAHQKDHRLSMNDLEIIAKEQMVSEDRIAMSAKRYVVVDTSPLTTLAYACYYFGEASGRLLEINRQYHQRSRLYVVCDKDIDFEDSADRSGPGSRQALQAILLCELKTRRLDFETASGTVQTRLGTVQNFVDNWRILC